MKLNLGCGTDIRQGYVNVDRLKIDNISSDTYKQGDISSLDWLVDNETVDEILAMDCLEYMPPELAKEALQNWCNKLKKDGMIKILVPDCFVVAQSFGRGQISIEEYSRITFGTNIESDTRLSFFDKLELTRLLNSNGFKIITQRYEGIALFVEAIKC